MKYIIPLFLLLVTPSTSKHLTKSDIEPPKRLVSNYDKEIRIGGLVPVHILESNDTLCKIHNPRYSFIRYRDGTLKCYKLNDAGVMWAEAMRFSVLAANLYLFNGMYT